MGISPRARSPVTIRSPRLGPGYHAVRPGSVVDYGPQPNGSVSSNTEQIQLVVTLLSGCQVRSGWHALRRRNLLRKGSAALPVCPCTVSYFESDPQRTIFTSKENVPLTLALLRGCQGNARDYPDLGSDRSRMSPFRLLCQGPSLDSHVALMVPSQLAPNTVTWFVSCLMAII